ncbi:hypothetical protein C8F01DRAFT_1179237 [Mycena amicta]|nr:hypothetical protein C8F01DRAFT_1179237 [Mycena amicta]
MSASPPSFDPTDTIGAIEIGAFGSFALFGITTAQLYIYYGRFPSDKPSLRLLVAFVWLCEMAHMICIGDVLYSYTIRDYGNPRSLEHILPSMSISVVVSAVITALVQGFFTFRIWSLGQGHSRSTISLFKIIPILLWISEFVYLLASTAATILAFGQHDLERFLELDGWLVFTAWVLNLVNDTTITASLVLLLVFNRARGMQKTTALVDKLIKWTIETGLITSLFSVLNLVFYVRDRPTFLWLAIQFVKARLFANSLLASLNSRALLREMDNTTTRDPTRAIALTTVTTRFSFTPTEQHAREQMHRGSSSSSGQGLEDSKV